ncbi:MAG: RluA family pseudouridine synthase [Bacteroidales bacterium]|jgi:23S rRNA pseudouridine1911/1915/1917 synthase|nr:RluA family pseudouridine synthase [Bacteroidales bacterium]
MNSSELEILYEDNHIIAVNKKAGQIVQGDKTEDIPISELLKIYLKEKYNKQGNVFLGVVHRLDRPVSGVVLFAKTTKALTRLNEMFKLKEAKKTYYAICGNKPPKDEDTLIYNIYRDEGKNKSFIRKKESKETKTAILRYKVINKSEKYFLLEIDLQTGRHHQIRCQLAEIGCPIKGDLKYGFLRSNPDASISLHSAKINFVHPIKQEPLIITAPFPKDNLWNILIENI